MECQHASAILAIIGLGFELGAIVSLARKFWPRRRDRTVEVPAAEARAVAGGNLRLGWNVEESHEAPRVPSIEELQARLDAIQQRIDVEVAAVHGEIDRTARKLREEMVDTAARTTTEAVRRSEEIHELIREQTREALAEQKREAAFFALGVLFQLAAAVVVLSC